MNYVATLYKKIMTTIALGAVVATSLFAVPAQAASLEKLFYYVPSESAYATLEQYITRINVFAPQVYKVSQDGTLTGKISDKVTALLVKNPQVKVMPLVFQEGFDSDIMHNMLASPSAQEKLIAGLIAEAKLKGYWGWQFDFEHMYATDRNWYASFVEDTAKAFKKEGLKLSVAVIARTSENPKDLPKGSWDYWAGVFDYKRIGAAADFVTLMAYDQPASPGPVASLPWVKQVLAYMEKSIPKSKISLGIPTYGRLWDVTTNKPVRSASHDKIIELEVNNEFTAKGYDTKLQTAWITYSEGDGAVKKNYKIWYEDIRSFKPKYDLVKKRALRGVSVWVIGMEDERIWSNLK